MSNVHNHETTPELFQHYPEIRRLDLQEKVNAEELLSFEMKPSTLRKVIRSSTGKAVTRKDICNLRASVKNLPKGGLSETEELLKELAILKKNDPMSSVYVCPDEHGQIQNIYFQTNEMKSKLSEHAEVLFMDITHNTNIKRMPLIVFMAVDSCGNNYIVAYCFIINECEHNIKMALKIFFETNLAVKHTKTIIIDKDQNVISSIHTILPHVVIHLCRFHAMKTLILHAQSEPQEARHLLQEILTKILHCPGIDDYNREYSKLQSIASEKFLAYYITNWHNCVESWAGYQRQTSTNYGYSSKSFVESHNQMNRKELKSTSSMAEAVRCLLKMYSNKTAFLNRQQSDSILKQSYIVGYNVKYEAKIRTICIPHAAELVVQQMNSMLKLTQVKMMSTGLIAGASKMEYKVTIDTCSCTFYQSNQLPCCHIFFIRAHNKLPLFEPQLVHERWTQEFSHQTAAMTENKETFNSKRERYNYALNICKELCEMLSAFDDLQFRDKLDLIQQLTAAWKNNESVTMAMVYYNRNEESQGGSSPVDPQNFTTPQHRDTSPTPQPSLITVVPTSSPVCSSPFSFPTLPALPIPIHSDYPTSLSGSVGGIPPVPPSTSSLDMLALFASVTQSAKLKQNSDESTEDCTSGTSIGASNYGTYVLTDEQPTEVVSDYDEDEENEFDNDVLETSSGNAGLVMKILDISDIYKETQDRLRLYLPQAPKFRGRREESEFDVIGKKREKKRAEGGSQAKKRSQVQKLNEDGKNGESHGGISNDFSEAKICHRKKKEEEFTYHDTGNIMLPNSLLLNSHQQPNSRRQMLYT